MRWPAVMLGAVLVVACAGPAAAPIAQAPLSPTPAWTANPAEPWKLTATAEGVHAPATAMPPPPGTGAVGARLLNTLGFPYEGQPYALTVHTVARPYTVPVLPDRVVAPGEVRLGAEVTLENTGTKPWPYSLGFFKLKDAAGREYKVHGLGAMTPGHMGGGSLAAGDRVRGWLVYELPASAPGVRLIFEQTQVALP